MGAKITRGDLPPLSVGIINFNGRDILESTLSSIFASDYPDFEVIMVDDCSTDDGVAFVEECFPKVRIFSQLQNMGPNSARNRVINEAVNELVFVSDNDVSLEPDCLRLLVERMIEDDDVAVCTPMVLDSIEKDKIYSNGAELHYACFGMIPMRGARLGPNVDMTPRQTVCGSGGIMLIRKSVAHALGYFDEDFIFGYDDGEFTFRVSSSGRKVMQEPNAKLYHLEKPGRSLNRLRYQIRGRFDLMLKTYSLRSLILLAPALIWFELANILFLLFKGAIGEWFKGAWLTLKSFGKIMEKRKAAQSIKRVPDNQLLRSGEIYMFPSRMGGSVIAVFKRMFEATLDIYWFLVSPFLTK